MRIPEDRQDPVIRKRPLARLLRHRIFARIRNVAHEQTVDDARRTSCQEINRRPGTLGPVPQKQTVLDHDGSSRRGASQSLVLHRDACTTWAGKVVNHFDVLDRRVGTAEDLDRPAIGKEKEVLGNGRVRLHLLGPFPRDKIICSGDAKALQHSVGRDPVAKINDMIDNRRGPRL